jgi:hypothetical protein
MSEHRAAFVRSKKTISDKHITIDNAQNSAKSFWVYELQISFFFGIYQTRQKTFPMRLAVSSFQNLKKKSNEKKFLLPELFLVTKPLSSSPAMLTDTTLESGESTILLQRLKIQETFPSYNVFFRV